MTNKEKDVIIQDNQKKFDIYIENPNPDSSKDGDRYMMMEFQNIHNGEVMEEKLPIYRATKICEPGLIGFDETLYPRFKADYGIHYSLYEN